MHELGPLRESEEEERIYRKVKRMQEVARQLYNSWGELTENYE